MKIPVTDWDRLAAADEFLMGSHHESVMDIRNSFMDGRQDRSPMVQFNALLRERFEADKPEGSEWFDQAYLDFMVDGNPVAKEMGRSMLAYTLRDEMPLWYSGRFAVERLLTNEIKIDGSDTSR